MRKLILSLLLACFCAVTACRKKPLPEPKVPPIDSPVLTGMLKIQLSNIVGAEALSLGTTKVYTTPGGETFTVSTYNYYLTNFVMTDDQGNRFAEPESYHLIKAGTPASLSFDIKNIPAGRYVSLEFMIGVDSLRNVSGAQSGDLSTEHEMFWSWSTGYIMAKMEGKVISSGSPISMHIAGFKGEYNVVQKVKLSLPVAAIISDSKTPMINLQSDLMKWFTTPNFKNFAENGSIGSTGALALKIAQNYSTMMSAKSVENP